MRQYYNSVPVDCGTTDSKGFVSLVLVPCEDKIKIIECLEEENRLLKYSLDNMELLLRDLDVDYVDAMKELNDFILNKRIINFADIE